MVRIVFNKLLSAWYIVRGPSLIIKVYRGQDVDQARAERDRLKSEGKNAWLTRDDGMRGVQCTYNLWVKE